MPAVIARLSRPPSRSIDPRIARSQPSSPPMSATTSADALRSTQATEAPRSRSSATSASPMPEEPPTTATRRPETSLSGMRDPGLSRGAQQLDDRPREGGVAVEHDAAVRAGLLGKPHVAAAQVEHG